MFVHFIHEGLQAIGTPLSNVVLVKQIDHDVMYIGPFIYTQFLN